MSEIKEDFLTADPPIPGQNYFCFSCVWPEKTLRRKEVFLMKHFLQNILTDPLHIKRLLDQLDSDEKLSYEEVEDIYESYVLANAEEVYKQFDEENDFQTSTRGIKVRGSYDTLKEARIRAEVLKRKDPNYDTWIGQVGYWCPLEPHGNGAEDLEQQFSEPVLNQLYSKKQENSIEKETVFDPLVQAEMAKQEAVRRESELNQLVKVNNDNLESGRDQFQREVQHKKDSAASETEKRKEVQKKEREVKLSKQKAASTNSSKKKRKVKKKKDSTSKPHQLTKSDLIKELRAKANKIIDKDSSIEVEETPVEETPVEETPVVETPVEKTPVKDADEKIKELRDILDKREQVMQSQKEIGNDSIGRVTTEDTNVNNSMMFEDKGADIFDGPDSDPWMQRKKEAEDNKLDDVISKVI